MSELKEAIGRLNLKVAIIAQNPFPIEIPLVKPVSLNGFIEEMGNKIDAVGIGKPTLNLDELLSEVKRQFKQKQVFYTKKEQANISFLLFRKDTDRSLFEYMLDKAIDSDLEKNVLSLFYTYLSDFSYEPGFEENTYRTKVLRNLLSKKFRQISNFRRKKLNKIKANFNYFFEDDINVSNELFVENINEKGFLAAFESIGLGQSYFETKFVRNIVSVYFNLTRDVNKAVTELQGINGKGLWTEEYPSIASYLIPKVQEDGHKQVLISIFNKAFGDPRLGAKSGWVNVNLTARETFLSWLTKQDLVMFFQVISRTNKSNMWQYRSDFWLNYLPHIKNAWMLLGPDARRFLRDKDGIYYGSILGSANDKSFFIFEIGDYVFCEGSDNAMLRIWKKGDAPAKIGTVYASYGEFVHSRDVVARFVHQGSQNFAWQKRVAVWILRNCGV